MIYALSIHPLVSTLILLTGKLRLQEVVEGPLHPPVCSSQVGAPPVLLPFPGQGEALRKRARLPTMEALPARGEVGSESLPLNPAPTFEA